MGGYRYSKAAAQNFANKNRKARAHESTETMWPAYFFPLSLFLCSIILVFIGYFFFSSLNYKATDYKICHTRTGKLSRRLGFYERFFLNVASANNTGSAHTVLFLTSEVKLEQEHVKRALVMLLERFPLLRMRVIHRFSHPYFEEMESPQSLDFRILEDVGAENWQDAFERQINGVPFNTQRGPLWRIALLRETSDMKGLQTQYRNTLLFSFHHAISDGHSIYELKKKLIEFLGLLYNGESTEVKSLPFRPPIECVMQHITPGIWERLMISANFTFRKLKVMFGNPQPTNLYLLRFPPPGGNSVAQKMCIIPRVLTKEETLAFIRCSKVNKCTVHGAITAATHLAMSQLLEQHNNDFKFPTLIDSTYPINVRKELHQPQIGREEFGLYASFDSLQIEVIRSYLESAQRFWKFAHSCTREIHRGIDSGKHRNFLKLFQSVNIPSFCALSFHETAHGLYKPLFNLNNLGSLSIDQEGNSPYRLAGSYHAVQSAQIGFVIGNNIFTINDRLYWTVEYSPEITTKTHAEEFLDLSLRILTNACSTNTTGNSTDSQ